MRVRSVAAVAVTAGLTLALSPVSVPRAQDSPLLSAMQDEMRRSMAELRMNGEPAPLWLRIVAYAFALLLALIIVAGGWYAGGHPGW